MIKDFNKILREKNNLIEVEKAKKAFSFIIFNEVKNLADNYFKEIDQDIEEYSPYYVSNPYTLKLNEGVYINIRGYKKLFTNDNINYFYSLVFSADNSVDIPIYYIDFVSKNNSDMYYIENEEIFDNLDKLELTSDEKMLTNLIIKLYINYCTKNNIYENYNFKDLYSILLIDEDIDNNEN